MSFDTTYAEQREDPAVWSGFQLVTCFGLGHFPASGTWGSIPPVVIAGALIAVGAGPTQTPNLYLGVIGVMFLLACAVCVVMGDRAEARWGKDPGPVVADEVAGMCIPLMLLPTAIMVNPWRIAVVLVGSFLLFRAFDIVKTPPADALQRIRGGWGILLDDIVAGAYALGVMWLISVITP